MDFTYRILDKLLLLFEILIFARVLLSWIPLDRNNGLVNFVTTVTEPVLSPIRKLIDRSIFGGHGQILDLSPLIAYLIITLLRGFIPLG